MFLMYSLQHLGVIAVTGEDAPDFLNAQCCNVLPGADGLVLNAWCSAAGRVIAVFLLLRRGACFYLLLPASLLAEVARGLRRYVLRARSEVQDVSADYRLFGTDRAGAIEVLGQTGDAPQWSVPGQLAISQRGLAVALPYAPERCLLLLPAASQLPGPEATGAVRHWQCMDLLAGMPWLHPASSERFLPQQLNLDLLEGMSLEKGCYPGQEIIARLQYRGQLKRRLFLLIAEEAGDHDLALAPDCYEPVHCPGAGQVSGYAIACAQDPDGRARLQAVLDLEQAQAGGAFPATCADQRFQVRPIPASPPARCASDD